MYEVYKIDYPKYLEMLSEIFFRKGYSLYIVGGFVRDAVMSYQSYDIDICSQASPEAVIKMLEGEKDFVVTQSNLPMGTIIIKHNEAVMEYTTFRRESYSRDGSHTPITVALDATINEDALRRDFTCNALYYDLSSGKIIDFFGGNKDIQSKCLKTTREPEDVFSEDALRILRMARISAETLFLPEKRLIKAANGLKSSLLMLSTERIITELQRLLSADTRYPDSNESNIDRGIRVLFECGAADTLFYGTQLKQSLLASKSKIPESKTAVFLKGCTDTKTSLDYICPNGKFKKNVLFLNKNSEYTDAHALDILVANGYEKGVLLEDYLTALDIKHINLTKYLNSMKQKDYIISAETLDINGNDIKELLGIKNSPKIGEIKKKLLRHIIQLPEENTNEKLLDYVKCL